jgi:hypothetical protein
MEEDSVSYLREKAKHELQKIQPSFEQDSETKQKQFESIMEQSALFADRVIKLLVAHTLEEDIDSLFSECINNSSSILITEMDPDNVCKKYTLSLDIVDKDYMLDLKQFKDRADVQERMVFLLNTVKVLYCPIKIFMKKWALNNNTSFNYALQIGLNTTLFLDKDSTKRIGIILTSVD